MHVQSTKGVLTRKLFYVSLAMCYRGSDCVFIDPRQMKYVRKFLRNTIKLIKEYFLFERTLI